MKSSSRLKIISVVGARPNFIKISPIIRLFKEDTSIKSVLVHTGQHYDQRMSDIFFNQLELSKPDHYLEVGSGDRDYQLSTVVQRFQNVVEVERPDVVLVVGDVNSTLAAAMVASKAGIPIVHVEAGLRSGDVNMPEEINRQKTDHLSDILFTTERSARINLLNEGIDNSRIHFVGNVMIDSLIHFRPGFSKIRPAQVLGNELNGDYVLMTMHRPTNVDERRSLVKILELVKETLVHHNVIFAVHPRTSASIAAHNLKRDFVDVDKNTPYQFLKVPPQGYLEFLGLIENAIAVVTDSGGIQEETTFLGVPCLTFRDTTERPITVEEGSNTLIEDLNPQKVEMYLARIRAGEYKNGGIPELWDGHTASRIVAIIKQKYQELE
jgi:UDP-N-acetylglucosamine 2-epimerase (non-hydrolysing)